MSQLINDRIIPAAATRYAHGPLRVLTMLSVDGRSFLVYTTSDKSSTDQPVIGRFGTFKAFTSAEQERQVQQALSPYLSTTDGSQPQGSFADVLVQINDLDLIAISRSGLASKEMTSLAGRLDLSGKEIARLLTLSPRTYHRRKPEQVLDPVASERLLLLTSLADHGYDVFEDQHKFNQWLRQQLRILGGQAPLDILDTSQGIRVVDTLLGRIEYGVYS
jgi:putative toxin-antitoxin system antitoxin component (TIGR02293 family)